MREKKNKHFTFISRFSFLVILGIRRLIMNIEMMTKNPQRSDWSLEEDTIIKCQNSFTTNKESNLISINTLIDVNKDESRRDEKTK